MERVAHNFIDLSGRVFSRLTVIERWGKIRKEASWLCVCECGSLCIVRGHCLRKESTRSCGCFSSESSAARFKIINRIHGMEGTLIYKTWASMLARCRGSHPNYGGRGIKVCKRWEKFENFYKDMGDKPHPDLSIERINNNRGYSPSNCKWATIVEQRNNTRKNTYYKIEGKRRTLKQIADYFNISYGGLVQRVTKSKNIKDAIRRGKKRMA